MAKHRVDYDKIAANYDAERYRDKEVDPDLQTFLAERSDQQGEERLAGLDISCGTGSQLAANRAQIPGLRLVGLDFHHGMLRQAIKKRRDIDWLQADGARLPLANASFDFISHQFAFHHIQDKASMLAEVYRVLRPAGRFVMSNLWVRKMPNWAIYRYFPAAWEQDRRDFPPTEAIDAMLAQAGFARVTATSTPWQGEDDLREFAEAARQRIMSQLITISEADYQAGLQKIDEALRQAESQVAGPETPILIPTEFCLLKIRAEKAI